MALPRPIVFGNWKMHGLTHEADALAGRLHDLHREEGGRGTLGIFPPATVLARVAASLAGSGIIVGGQDCHTEAKGAYTGSISAPMLKDAGATAVIVGHSERRHGLGESDTLVRAKAEAALAAGFLVVLCIGETEAEWLEGRTLERLAQQLEQSLPRSADPESLVVAYEPVWAIGTGRSASSDDIARSHALVHERMAAQIEGGAGVPVLYGGSVKPDNAGSILAVDGVEGVLVGGACLEAQGFFSMLSARPPA
jgi:triosephosphate isomerase